MPRLAPVTSATAPSILCGFMVSSSLLALTRHSLAPPGGRLGVTSAARSSSFGHAQEREHREGGGKELLPPSTRRTRIALGSAPRFSASLSRSARDRGERDPEHLFGLLLHAPEPPSIVQSQRGSIRRRYGQPHGRRAHAAYDPKRFGQGAVSHTSTTK